MAVYPIKVSLKGKEIVYDPEVCVVDSDPAKSPNYILFFLDNKSDNYHFIETSPGLAHFQWDKPASAARVFKPAEILKEKKVIVLENSGANNNGNPEYWSYEIHVLTRDKKRKHVRCKKARNGKNPIIINK